MNVKCSAHGIIDKRFCVELWARACPHISSFSIPHSSSPLRFLTLSLLASLRECCDWVNRAVLCGVLSVCHYPCGRRTEWSEDSQTGLWKAIFIPARLFLWAQAPNIDLAPVTLMKHVPPFFFLFFFLHWFKSTYVISSCHHEKVAIRYHLALILQLSPPVVAL